MAPEDKEAFVRTLTGLASIKNGKITPEALDLWWLSMQSWEIETFRMAATALVKSCQFMPTPKDFEDLRKAGRPTPGEAWSLAKASWSSGRRNPVTGEYSGSSSGDDMVDRCVRMIGGYTVLAQSSDEQLQFIERRFCEHYESLQDVVDIREAVPEIAAPTGALARLKAGLEERKKLT